MDRLGDSANLAVGHVPPSKALIEKFGSKEEAEKNIQAVLARDGALVLAWCDERVQNDMHHDLDRTSPYTETVESFPAQYRPGILRMLAVRFLESNEV